MAKKKRNERSSKPDRKGQDEPSLPDRRALEKQLVDINKLLREQEFESVEEINDFLNRLYSSAEPLPVRPPETPLEKAQEIMFQAFDAQGRKRIKLARKALKVSEDCTDAYVLLAEEAARTPQEALELYENGMRAAERTLGAEIFTEHAGHFWGITETRPYMRARAGLATVLWEVGRHDEAIDHLHDLLRLNPNDNQGLRYFLATTLLHTGRYAQLSRLLKSYSEESTAYWTYTTALLTFIQEGETVASNRALRQALEANPYVTEYLLGHEDIPRRLPDFVGFGDENEAVDYVSGNFHLWARTPGALPWLAQQVGDDELPDEWDAGEDEIWLDEEFFDEAEEAYFPFEFDPWVEGLEIPRKEHTAIRRCLRRGVGAYSEEYYGRDRFKRQTQDIIDEQLELPFVFGYAATAILEDNKISDETKEKVVEFALLTLQPTMFQGIPYGLLQMLGFLAQNQRLLLAHLILGLLSLEVNSLLIWGSAYWTDGVTSPSMAALGEWIAASEDLENDEKLWLAWKLSVNCESAAHLGKAFANAWFDHPGIPDEFKRELCWSWLDDNREVGAPHYSWRLMQALMNGDLEEIKRIKKTYQLDLDDLPLPDPDELAPVVPDNLMTSIREHRHVMMSPYLKRLAIPTLVRLGEDLHELIELFWDHENDYFEPILKMGIGDAIVQFPDRLEPDELRSLIERGVHDGKAQVRKPFFLLSTNFYGDEYLHRALDDNAASIRRWAAKKLKINT